MNTIEFSRISGIILDNAIEASEVLDDPLIQIALLIMKNLLHSL